MKIPSKWFAACVCAGMLAVPSVVQADDSTSTGQGLSSSTTTTTSDSSKDTARSQQFFRSKDLVGANVKDSAGQKVGDISEIYLHPQNGHAFAAIGLEGDKHAVVPLQALNATPGRGLFGNAEVTLNKSKSELQSAPTIRGNDWKKLDDPSFTQNIYTHYNVQAPSAMGGASDTDVSSSTGASSTSPGTSSSSDSDSSDKDN